MNHKGKHTPPDADERLMAYADGQLPAPESEALRAQLAIDPELRESLSAYILTRDLGPLFCDAMVRPLPDSLREVLSAPIGAESRRAPAATREASGLARALASLFSPGRNSWALGVALSIGCLILGSVGTWMASRHLSDIPTTIIATAGNGLRISSRLLEAALDSRPSGTALAVVDDTGRIVFSIVPRLTFAAKNGHRACRKYDLRLAEQQDGHVGVACRTGTGRWAVEKQLAFTFPKSSSTKPAGDGPIEDFIEGIREGRSLTIEEEERVLSSGWRDALPKQ